MHPYRRLLVGRQSKKRKWLDALPSLISFLTVVDGIVTALKGREMRSYYLTDMIERKMSLLHFPFSPNQQAHRRALSLSLLFLFVIKLWIVDTEKEEEEEEEEEEKEEDKIRMMLKK